MFCFLLLRILDNTFIGTLFAGALLAMFGLFLYRQQKQTDIEYDDFRKNRELASALFACLESAASDYNELLNIADGSSNPQVQALKDRIAQLGGDPLGKYDKLFNFHISEINKALKALIAQLKLNFNSKYDHEIGILSKEIPTLNFYLSAVLLLIKLNDKSADITSLRQSFTNSLDSSENELKEIIKVERVK